MVTATDNFLDDLLVTPDALVKSVAEVRVAANEMSAVADIHPAGDGMKPIDPDAIAELLNSNRITTGVDWNAIKEAVFRCNTERVRVADLVIARGMAPIDEIPEHLVIENELLMQNDGNAPDKMHVDYKASSPFVLVKNGQLLATYAPKKPGQIGTTVMGEALPYKVLKIPAIEPGENTRKEGANIVADCEGRFEHNRTSFWVNEVLEVVGDVDYTTGHIDFPGDVIVHGEVKDGFTVHSGGSVFCAMTLDATEVVVKKDLVVKQGIIGRNRGRIAVGGDVKAKFLENCDLEVKGAVYIERGILNSTVHTRKQVKLGHRGALVGGKIHAQDGLVAAQIGSAAGTRTEICCGVDYTAERKLAWIRKKNIELALKLSQIDGKLETPSSGNEKLSEMRDKIKQAIHQHNETAGALVFQVDRNEEAEVIVQGDVYPGTYIEICHVSFVVSKQLRNVCFKLDKAKGKVIAESLVNRRRK